MSAIERLLKQLDARGISIKAGDQPGQLLLVGPSEEKTPMIVEAVKAFKLQLLQRMSGKEPQTAPVETESER